MRKWEKQTKGTTEALLAVLVMLIASKPGNAEFLQEVLRDAHLAVLLKLSYCAP